MEVPENVIFRNQRISFATFLCVQSINHPSQPFFESIMGAVASTALQTTGGFLATLGKCVSYTLPFLLSPLPSPPH